jgi:hypothetical protein
MTIIELKCHNPTCSRRATVQGNTMAEIFHAVEEINWSFQDLEGGSAAYCDRCTLTL